MKEAANPKSAAMIAGVFISILAGAITLVSVDDMAVGGAIFSILVLLGLGLLTVGLVVSWRTRKQTFEFREPTGRAARITFRLLRIVAGSGLAAAGGFMTYLSVAMYSRGEGFPVMGFIMGVLIFLFGLYGFRSGLSKGPIQPPETTRGKSP